MDFYCICNKLISIKIQLDHLRFHRRQITSRLPTKFPHFPLYWAKYLISLRAALRLVTSVIVRNPNCVLQAGAEEWTSRAGEVQPRRREAMATAARYVAASATTGAGVETTGSPPAPATTPPTQPQPTQLIVLPASLHQVRLLLLDLVPLSRRIDFCAVEERSRRHSIGSRAFGDLKCTFV